MKCGRAWQSLKAVTVGQIHRWMLWWFDVGLVIAVVALVNLPFLNLTRTKEQVIFIFCVSNWLLSGLVCWAYESIQPGNEVEPRKRAQTAPVPQEREWHSASEFRLPGGGRTLLPLTGGRHTRETLAHYGFHHRGRQHRHA